MFVDPQGTSSGSALVTVGPRVDPGTPRIEWYSFDDENCTARVDPITAVFFTRYAIENVQRHVNHHTDWDDVNVPSPQYFSTNERCAESTNESADDPFFQSRFHIRFKRCDPTPTYSSCTTPSSSFTIVLGTPHYEDMVDCAHAVRETVGGWSGFDEGRRKLYNTMYKTHYVFRKYQGNSRQRIQCDNQIAESNGYVRYIRVPQ
jgi:hypothetical protein